MAFKDNIRQIEQYVKATEIAVLVWGPGEGAGEHSEKREKIRKELQSYFPRGEIRFSEDPGLKEIVPGASELGSHEQELWHLAACDVCVVLDTSKGAGEEIAHFVGSKFAYKLLILTHERYKTVTSFPSSLRQRENQVFYSEEEYKVCSLVERALARVRQVALGKYAGLTV